MYAIITLKHKETAMDKVLFYDCYKYNRNWLLIEMTIDESSQEIDFGEFAVPQDGADDSDWQVPYMEQYLSSDGTEKVCETYDLPQPPVKPCRAAFFIYKTDGKILRTPYGEFSVEKPNKLPERLKRIVEFEKPD